MHEDLLVNLRLPSFLPSVANIWTNSNDFKSLKYRVRPLIWYIAEKKTISSTVWLWQDKDKDTKNTANNVLKAYPKCLAKVLFAQVRTVKEKAKHAFKVFHCPTSLEQMLRRGIKAGLAVKHSYHKSIKAINACLGVA